MIFLDLDQLECHGHMNMELTVLIQKFKKMPMTFQNLIFGLGYLDFN